MSFFLLMHDDLDLIDEGNIELIIIYVLNVLTEATKNGDLIAHYYTKNLFSVFGKYLITEPIKKEFLNLLCHIVENFTKKDYIYFGAYDQLINSTPTENREKIKEYVLLNTNAYFSDNFFKNYNDGDYFGF